MLRRLRLLLAGLIVLVAAPALADDARDRAREHYDRGLRLFDQGSDDAALAEFQAAYALVPHPSVLYSLGLVYASLGRPVPAREALDKLLASDPPLAAAELSRARETLEATREQIGTLTLVTSAPAAVQVDGLDVGTTPLAEPVAVARGTHLLSVMAPGHVPVHREIHVAGRAETHLDVTLEALPGDPSHLSIEADVMGAEVLVDGERVGATPLPTTVAIRPGRRVVEVRRAGYRPFRQTIDVSAGSTGAIEAALPVDRGALATTGARLTLRVSEAEAVAFVDGAAQRGLGPFALPPGPHRVRVERAGFLPAERTVVLEPRQDETVPFVLDPTAEERGRYVEAASRHRIVSLITLGVGAAIAVPGTTLWLLNQGKKTENQRDYDRTVDRCETYADASPERVQCVGEAGTYLDRKDELGRADWIFAAIAGTGLVTAGTGLALYLTGDDPGRFDLEPESDVFGGLRLDVRIAPGRAALSVDGAF